MLPVTIEKLLEIVEGIPQGGSCTGTVAGIATDNRQVKPGDLFVAFVGEKTDGHNFITDAFARGARVALVTKEMEPKNHPGTVIRVKDALSAVQALAKFERSRFNGPVIGVTGSNGKTTSKDMLAAVLSTLGPCLATSGNHNNELGLPLTILGYRDEHQSIVLEMGMRGMGQIAKLCEIARPTAGIITNIGQSHLELLGSQENIAKAKSELLEALPTDGVSVLSADDPWLVKMAHKSRAKVLWYSISTETDAYASDIHTATEGISFTAHVLGKSEQIVLPTHGLHNVANALGALLVGSAHGCQLADMAEALRQMQTTGGRLQLKQGPHGWTVIDDTYNASPASVQASLSTMKDIATGRPTVAVLGDMYELGDYTERGHREVGEFAAEVGIHKVVAIGPTAALIAEGARARGCKEVTHFPDKQDALRDIRELIPNDAMVLVKASRGMKLEDIVSQLTE